jgi:hypothetical protein
MEPIPRRKEFDSTTEWLRSVAEETDTPYEVLTAVAVQLRPELISLPESDKRDQLQRLLKSHTDFMTEEEGNANAWIDLYFDRGDGVVDVFYQYSMMTHNLPKATEEVIEAMGELAEEEDIALTVDDHFVMGSQLDWDGVEEELRLVRKILTRIYDVDIDDIVQAEEQRDGELISWTET